MIKTWTKDYNIRTKRQFHFLKKSSEDFDFWDKNSRNNRYFFYYKNKKYPIKKIFKMFPIKSVIDYGCGYGNSLYDCEVDIFRYDPFVEQFKQRPTKSADLVISNNVINTIEQEYLETVLEDIYNLTNKYIIINTVCVNIDCLRYRIKKIFNFFQKKKVKILSCNIEKRPWFFSPNIDNNVVFLLMEK